MGMITTVKLEPGLCFGPLPTDWMIADPAYLIAQTTTDQLPELPTVIVNPLQLSDPHRLVEWVCNLRSARYPGEQNVELIRDPTTGHSFYYIIRPIDAGQEMFVWFRRADINPLAERVLKQRLAVDAWLGLDEASDMTQAACDQAPGRVSVQSRIFGADQVEKIPPVFWRDRYGVSVSALDPSWTVHMKRWLLVLIFQAAGRCLVTVFPLLGSGTQSAVAD
ncbi:hypothetical protein CLF_102695 [Clonorchis sinensis]|uniref:Uncharacterized protein n=1 Tax=Clonorchis sinensis TaxID=79923 RepID=G7Y8D2_CLOSI|nr:hypothetical protein CLF_102695 [Clonorchis sinensis]